MTKVAAVGTGTSSCELGRLDRLGSAVAIGDLVRIGRLFFVLRSVTNTTASTRLDVYSNQLCLVVATTSSAPILFHVAVVVVVVVAFSKWQPPHGGDMIAAVCRFATPV